jgi:hypothetical protein
MKVLLSRFFAVINLINKILFQIAQIVKQEKNRPIYILRAKNGAENVKEVMLPLLNMPPSPSDEEGSGRDRKEGQSIVQVSFTFLWCCKILIRSAANV